MCGLLVGVVWLLSNALVKVPGVVLLLLWCLIVWLQWGKAPLSKAPLSKARTSIVERGACGSQSCFARAAREHALTRALGIR